MPGEREALLARARQALRDGDIETATAGFKTLTARPGAPAADFLELGEALWVDFRFDAAVRAFQNAADHEPSSPAALILAAKRLFSLGRFAQSATFLESALKRTPQDASIRRMLAEVLDREGKCAEAEALARKTWAENPNDARAARALAHILRGLGRTPEAIDLLQRHAKDYPGPETWRVNQELATCLDRVGDYPGAMSALTAAKAQLRNIAQPLLQQWRERSRRREEFATSLDAATLRRWQKDGAQLDRVCQVAILAGHPRSGTTLLEQMLAAHSGVVTTDETGVLRNQFVEPIVLAAASTHTARLETDAFDQAQLEAGRAFYFRATEAHVGESLRDRYLIEKDPLATWDLGLMLRLLPEANVIFPLRDPRDVCISFFFTLVPLNADSAPAIDLASTCEAAAFSLGLWQHWRRVIPQRWAQVRYERLVQQPRAELEALAGTLDLPWEESMVAPHGRAANRGVRTPTYRDVAQPLYTRAIGRWRNYAKWLEPALGTLRELIKEFGYD